MPKSDWIRVASFLLNAALCAWVYIANQSLTHLKESDENLKEFLTVKIASIEKQLDRHENGPQHNGQHNGKNE